jgi:hypothetical protein
VRKIISIMVTLGLVLGLVVMAAPAAAQVCEDLLGPIVLVTPPCACAEAVYNITFNITASLTEGVGCVCVQFPAGTKVPASFETGDIQIGVGASLVDVYAEEITVTGTKVCFVPPADITGATATSPLEISVIFNDGAGITGIENPCVPGDYTLSVWTCRAPDSTPQVSLEYEIIPAVATFGFVFDFRYTYPDLALGFVPPFQACGQNDTDQIPPAEFDTVWGPDVDPTLADGFYDQFGLYLMALIDGCEGPCKNATVWFELTACPTGEQINLWLQGVVYNLTVCNVTKTVGKLDSTTDWKIATGVDLSDPLAVVPFGGLLHFSSPGTYEMRFYAECPKTTCSPGGIVASKTQAFKVYQKKEAYKLELCEKWNLFSLPLVPLENGSISIAAALASIENILVPLKSQIVSIWNYDAFGNAWKVWTANTTDVDTLTTLEDGKAYWMRLAYPLAVTTDGDHPECCEVYWWVFGTEKPEPPSYPSQYAVNTGWNMVGFTSTVAMNASSYLWNWATTPAVVYGYTHNCWNLQNWQMIPFSGTGGLQLVPGDGYWMAFPKAGTVYVP